MKLHRQCLKKKAYRTEEFALKVARGREAKGSQALRVYWCRFCSFFHITRAEARAKGEDPSHG